MFWRNWCLRIITSCDNKVYRIFYNQHLFCSSYGLLFQHLLSIFDIDKNFMIASIFNVDKPEITVHLLS